MTVVQRRNVASYGAESRIWKLEQPTGNYDSPRFGELSKESKYRDGFSWENCLFDKALESPWETIYFNDRMVKHEVRPFHREAGRSGPCHRDVIVNFVRKPLSDGSDFRHCEDEDEDSEDPRDEARSPYIRERPEKNQSKNTEHNPACSSSPLLAPP